MTAPTLGQPIPDFSAPATSGQTITLSSLKGRYVILYFYPRTARQAAPRKARTFAISMRNFSNWTR